MSAKIHSVSAQEYRAMTPKARVDYLASVASEFISTTGRGKSKRPAVVLPESYTILFNRRVRQGAKMRAKEGTPKAEVLADAEALHAEVLAKAIALAEKANSAAAAA